jgi:hypothetical protein
MTNPFTFPLLGASILVAVTGGIQLGESTIGLIDPVHFQGPAIHPRERGAAIDESQIRPVEPGFASFYGWDEAEKARLQDCGGCEAIAARDLYFDGTEPSVTIHRAPVEEWVEPGSEQAFDSMGGPDETGIRHLDAELEERVVRYAYYEIETSGEPETIHSEGE